MNDAPPGIVLLRPDGEEFRQRCSGWNSRIVHRPKHIVAAMKPEHVEEAVRFAAERDMPIRVNSTGHGALAACDGGMFIDVSGIGGVIIHPEQRCAVGHGGTLSRTRRAGILGFDVPFSGMSITPDAATELAVVALGKDLDAIFQPYRTDTKALTFLLAQSKPIGAGEAQRVRTAFRPEHYTRLAAIKARYDPNNLFGGDRNIPPTL